MLKREHRWQWNPNQPRPVRSLSDEYGEEQCSSAEQLSGSETTPRSGRGGSDARRVSSARGDHLIKSPLMDEGLGRSCIQEGAPLNRDVVETPLWSDNKVVNAASSMVTTPLIKSGPYSGMRGASMSCSWAKSLSGACPSGTDSVKAESVAVWVLAEGGSVSKRRCVTGSTSKAVSPVSSRGTSFSGAGLKGGAVMSRRRISRACFKACPSRF